MQSQYFLSAVSFIDLISLGRNLFKNLGFKSPSGKINFFCLFCLFLFIFIFSIKVSVWIISFFTDEMKKVEKKRKMAKDLTLPHWNLNPGFLNKTFLSKIWILREIRSIQLTVLKKSWLYYHYFWQYDFHTKQIRM